MGIQGTAAVASATVSCVCDQELSYCSAPLLEEAQTQRPSLLVKLQSHTSCLSCSSLLFQLFYDIKCCLQSKAGGDGAEL